MRVKLKNLIPLSIETNKTSNKNVGEIIKFEQTEEGMDIIVEITNKKLINKLRKNINKKDRG